VLCSPLLWLIIYLTHFFSPKISTHLLSQKQTLKFAVEKINQFQNGRIIVLFHAASAGEFEQLKPVLNRIDRNKYFIIQSYMSPTIFNVEKDTTLADATCYLSFDLPWSVYSFLKNINPTHFIITRHDVWPNLVVIAKSLGINISFINVNFHEKTIWSQFGFKSLGEFILNKFDVITTGSERLKNNISKLIPSNKVKITGDTRFDQILDRSKIIVDHFKGWISDSQNIIFGSIDEQDYPVIFDSFNKLYPQGNESLISNNHRVIIVPHEVDNNTITKIENHLRELNIASVRFTKMNEQPPQCIIVDTVGMLADMYANADLAYVGSGFSTGVHSVIEPAIHGCVVSFGPVIHILDEAIELHNLGLGKMIHNSRDLQNFISLLDNQDELAKLQKETHSFVKDKCGGSQKILDIILN